MDALRHDRDPGVRHREAPLQVAIPVDAEGEETARITLRIPDALKARAEELAGELVVDVVTARAVAPLERLAGWALPLLRPGGRLLALKGERADAELAESGGALRRAGASSARVVQVGDEGQSEFLEHAAGPLLEKLRAAAG